MFILESLGKKQNPEGERKMSRVCLVVEDEVAIRELVGLILEREGFQAILVPDAETAIQHLNNPQLALVVVDWMLPGESGLELIRKTRSLRQNVGVLMLTAKAMPEDIVQGLEAGADDYLTKPFDPTIFKARVRAVTRRTAQEKKEKEEWKLGELNINVPRHEVTLRGQPIHLTPSEFKILLELTQNMGRVLTREHLMSRVQGEGIVVTGRTIDTHVFALRKKLLDHADWIETIRGVGYRVRSDESSLE